MTLNNRNVEFIINVCVCIVALLASILLSGVVPVFAQSPIVRRQSVQVGFQNQWEEITVAYTFGLDGGLNVEDSRGSQFYFAPPKFQPNVPYAVSLSENESFVTQYFFVNGTDKHGVVQTLQLCVDYDFSKFNMGAKITLRGDTTDPDSEIEYEFENPKGANIANMTTSYQIGNITFDWSDLEGATTFAVAINKLKIKFASTFNLDPTICTATSYSLSFSSQQHIVCAAGRFWVFYWLGSLFYRSSVDGATWTSAGTVDTEGGFADVFQEDASTVNIAWSSLDIRYRRGTLLNDGSITWAAATQIVNSSWLGVSATEVAIDSSGYPYVVYQDDDPSKFDVYVTKSDTNDGTWSTDASYPVLVNSTNRLVWSYSIVALTANKTYIAYCGGYAYQSPGAQPFYGLLYNGTSWQAEETITPATVYSERYHLLAVGDDVYLLYSDSFGVTHLKKRTYSTGTWATVATLQIASLQNQHISLVDSSALWLFGQASSYVYWQTYNPSTSILSGVDSMQYESMQNLNVLSSEATNNELAYVYETTATPVYIKFARITTQPPEIPEVEIPSGLSPTEEEKPPAEEGPKEEPILPELGIWGLLGAVGVIAVGGLMTVSGGEPRRRKGKSDYKPSQPRKTYYHKSQKPQTYRRMKS